MYKRDARMPRKVECCSLPFYGKNDAPTQRGAKAGASPPRGPVKWMHKSVRGLLAVSLGSQRTADSGGSGSECIWFARSAGDVAPMRDGLPPPPIRTSLHFRGITVTAVVVIGCGLLSGQVAAVYTAYQSGSPCIHATTVRLRIWHVTR
jgi:hypothetical protein